MDLSALLATLGNVLQGTKAPDQSGSPSPQQSRTSQQVPAILQNNQGPQGTSVPGPSVAQAPDQNAVGGIDVVAKRPAQPAHTIYDNSADIQAAQQGQDQIPQHHGAFGVKGTLRDILGSIGDAFLVAHDKAPYYANRRQQEKESDAMIGFQADPRAAAGRLAAIPGAGEHARQLYDDYQKGEALKAQEALRQAQVDATKEYRDGLNTDRNTQRLERIIPYVGALVSDPNIKTPEDYKKAHDRAMGMARRISPDITGADIGLIDPADWQPGAGSTTGMTSGQVARVGVSNKSIQEREDASKRSQDGADRRAAAAQAGANSRSRPTTASTIDRLLDKQNRGETLTPAEQTLWSAYTTKGKPARQIPAALAVGGPGGGTPAANNNPQPKMVIRGGKLVPK